MRPEQRLPHLLTPAAVHVPTFVFNGNTRAGIEEIGGVCGLCRLVCKHLVLPSFPERHGLRRKIGASGAEGL